MADFGFRRVFQFDMSTHSISCCRNTFRKDNNSVLGDFDFKLLYFEVYEWYSYFLLENYGTWRKKNAICTGK
jgi:hypothetical protein